ncbi:MAG: hypothetical protein ABSD74_13795 [Rhizomicrobium sp.]|jgi:hypothetical protein
MPTLPLADWRDFYVMIGTASGAIVGATFIVATLAGGLPSRSIGIRGFITPTAVHLGSVLVGSAILTVPTLTPLFLSILLGAGGFAGVAYSVVVSARIWKMNLDRDDRIFYTLLPVFAYGALAVAAIMAQWHGTGALEILAVSLVVLLIIGMRNAWDMTTFMVTRDKQE